MVQKLKTFFHSFVHFKIREMNCGEIINNERLKELVGRICVKENGGGLPHFVINYIIRDLVNMKLIKKVGKSCKSPYRIMSDRMENRIKEIVSSYSY